MRKTKLILLLLAALLLGVCLGFFGNTAINASAFSLANGTQRAS